MRFCPIQHETCTVRSVTSDRSHPSDARQWLNRVGCKKGPGADSEEKHEPVSDIDTAVVDSPKAFDPTGRLEKRTSEGISRCSGESSLPKGSFKSIGYGLPVLGAGHEAACHNTWQGD